MWTKGELNIVGGDFVENQAENGGVVYASEKSMINLTGGNFFRNEALDGGAVYVDKGAALSVKGGTFSYNAAGNGGGSFYVTDNAHIKVRRGYGGIFGFETNYLKRRFEEYFGVRLKKGRQKKG